MKNKKIKPVSELRQDPVSGDWILLAPLRGRRQIFRKRAKAELSKNKCPFENPPEFGNEPPVLVYQKEAKNDWFLQIIPNKYPAVGPGGGNTFRQKGLYKTQAGVGFHEIVVFRDHNRYLADFTKKEIKEVLMAYQERYKSLAKEKCVEYISIFHNHGKEAGSTIPHSHSQILALSIVPPDVSHSLNGSRRYFNEHKRCVHCQMISQELKEKKRIVYQNKDIIVIIPFASRTDFEVRIFPKKHFAYFEKIKEQELISLADALKFAFSKIYKNLADPAFNFFIHTAPTIKNGDYHHYHWHIEILPKFGIFGGFELGTGMDIISVAPEKAAQILKK
ncbi:MAG: galactose-1-phosphate uridylyltransferase [Candidatus Azambacteria bacterium]|nr:galactose-1-phosphate uridylyltransferase [Candidatus Azambacteria bacterium]